MLKRAFFVALLMLMLLPATTIADGPLDLSVKELVIQGQIGRDLLQASFSIRAMSPGISNVNIVTNDLVAGDPSNPALVASDLSVHPSNIDALPPGRSTTVTVDASKLARPGVYSSTLFIEYDIAADKVSHTERVPLVLKVNVVKPTTMLRTPDNANFLLKLTRTPTFLLGFTQQSSTVLLSAGQDGSAITLRPLLPNAIRRQDGVQLPLDSITLAPPPGVMIEPGGKQLVTLTVDGDNALPGHYTGSVLATAINGSTVDIPVDVSVKDSPIAPILLLAAGVLISFLLSRWNAGGRKAYEAFQILGKLAARLRSTPLLQKDERAQVESRLQSARAALNNEEIDQGMALLAEVDKLLGTFRTNAETLAQDVSGTRDSLVGTPDSQLVPKVLANLRDLFNRFLQQLQQGNAYDSINQARNTFEQDLKVEAGRFQAAMTQLDTLRTAGKLSDDAKQKLANASTLDEMESIIESMHPAPASIKTAPEAGAEQPVTTQEQRVPLHVQWWRTWILDQHNRLRLTRLGLIGVLYVVLLWFGLNTIYVKNDTFGADPIGDYLALVLWGLAADTARARSAELTSITQRLFGDTEQQASQPVSSQSWRSRR